MGRDLAIASRLRDAGLVVVEVDGWRERGSDSFEPTTSGDHHTAGARQGNAPSLKICINGRGQPGEDDYLPGPLCNVLMGRDNTAFVIASGRANHAGKGSWRGQVGNSRAYGVERENIGTPAEPWRPDQTDAAARCHAALMLAAKPAGPKPWEMVWEHKEWAPGRKVDAHTITGDEMRRRVAALMQPQPQPTPSPELPDMDYFILNDNNDATGDQWYWWPELGGEKGTKAIIPGPNASFAGGLANAEASRRFCGRLFFDRPDLDAIPTLR